MKDIGKCLFRREWFQVGRTTLQSIFNLSRPMFFRPLALAN